MKKGLCIYHDSCNDGFAAALAVWKKYGDEWDYKPMQYGEVVYPLRPELYEAIMLVDFSLPRDYMIKLSRVTNLLVIDHHKTAMEACEGLDFCKFDLSKSGCEATWEHLFPDEAVPDMFRHIGDRDLWKFIYIDTKRFCAGLSLYERDFEVWNNICDREECFINVLRQGETLLKLQEKEVKEFVNNWNKDRRFAYIECSPDSRGKPYMPWGAKVPIANCCTLISEKIGALSNGYPFAIGYFETATHRVFSLRTRRDDVDCGIIAKKYGGGGHPGAAGFKIPLSNLDPEMNNWFWEDVTRFK